MRFVAAWARVGPLGQTLDEGAGLLVQIVVRHNAVHDSPLEHCLRRVRPGGQNGLGGATRSCPGGDALRSSAEGRGTDHALEQSELSVLRGPDQIAGQSHLQARCKAQPVHGGDGGDA